MGYNQINRKVTIGDKKHFAKLRKKQDLAKTKHKAINKYARYSKASNNPVQPDFHSLKNVPFIYKGVPTREEKTVEYNSLVITHKVPYVYGLKKVIDGQLFIKDLVWGHPSLAYWVAIEKKPKQLFSAKNVYRVTCYEDMGFNSKYQSIPDIDQYIQDLRGTKVSIQDPLGDSVYTNILTEQ